MKALSLWQPWASAIALGWKKIETRSWRTNYLGRILIHAGKSQKGDDLEHPVWLEDCMLGFPAFRELPFGALIAVADLVDCKLIPEFIQITDQERQLGDYIFGRYAWILSNVRALPEPIPFKGRQGLFEVPDDQLPREVWEKTA